MGYKDLKQYKSLIFDFDGVILDSEEVKIKTFLSLFKNYPNHYEKIDEYNKANRGISRFVKFDFIYQNILRAPFSEKDSKILGEKYSKLLNEKMIHANLVKGIENFLKKQTVLLFIASSAPSEEIEKITKKKNIKKHFKKIYGHPILKEDAIKKILIDFQLKSEEVLFFGDAEADLEAAVNTKVDFVARTDSPEKFPKNVKKILDFNELIPLRLLL